MRTKDLNVISRVDALKIDTNSSTSLNDYKEYTNYFENILLGISWIISIVMVIVLTMNMYDDN